MTGVSDREYFEAILEEQKRATEMAEREREKAAQALREEQHRAALTAEAEREKAASALRSELARRIEEGDERLREHITQQVMQINAALESAEKLEVERVTACHTEVRAVEKAIVATQEASEKAITKAEMATERRFEAVNEFRAQLSDQTNTFLPREVYDAQHEDLRARAEAMNAELRGRVEALDLRITSEAGAASQARRSQDRVQPWQVWMAGVMVTIVLTVVVLAANGSI